MAYDQTPERMTLVNLNTGFGVSAQFNPEELKDSVEVAFNRLAVLGMSHQPMQYQYTGNLKVSFDLGFDAWSNRDIITQGGALSDDQHATMATRSFIFSLCYPSRAAQDVAGGAPPRVLFVWPNLYALVAHITKVSSAHKRFNMAGMPTHFVLSIELEEIRDVRIFSEDVLVQGTRRSAALALAKG